MKIHKSQYINPTLFIERGREFNATTFILNKYDVGNTYVSDYNSYSSEALKLIEANGEMIWAVGSLKDGEVATNSALILYKDNVIHVEYEKKDLEIDEFGEMIITNRDEFQIDLTYYVPLGYECVAKEFLPYVIVPKPPKKAQAEMSLLLKTGNGSLCFYPFSTDLVDINLPLSYGENFAPIDATIQEKLNEEKAGLYIFRGPPGTGKSTYIKYLTSQLDREVLFIPNNMAHMLSDPGLLTILLEKQGSVIVLEDAEKMIVDREENSESPVSSILNLTDGFLSNVLNIAIILTFNCDKQHIDRALLRKGRLSFDYEFGKLSTPDAQKLLNSLNANYVATEPMSLAEIFFVNDPNSAEEVAENKLVTV